MDKSCQLNDGDGCYFLGLSYLEGTGIRQSTQKAKEYFGKACDLGCDNGCNEYAKLNKKGL